jgi:RNA polymerase sigma factor (sigma-70 family)
MPVPLLALCPAVGVRASDAELLCRFTEHRDQAAFTELVRRHGPLVHRVCRRLAPTVADDAFQGVFLTLVCRAGSIRTPGALASWLVGVAGRVARQMQHAELRQTARERAGSHPIQVPGATLTGSERADVAAVLDEELSLLPERLRDPVVLCLVHGRTHDQAAAELGGSARTLRRRLERARALLRARLEQRGVVPVVAAAILAGLSAPARAVPAPLVRQTVSGVFRFLDGGPLPPVLAATNGVMGNMVRFKVSALVASVAVVLVGLGVGWSGERSAPPIPGQTRTVDAPNAKVPAVGESVTLPPTGTAPGGVSFRGPNFVVYAPTEVMARVIATEAEHHRRELARTWLGRELPPWSKPCVIRYKPGAEFGGPMRTFAHEKNRAGELVLSSAEVGLSGPFLPVLTTALPREVMHVIVAAVLGESRQRWAEEGIALQAESEADQAERDARARELLNAGRGLKLKVLLRMIEYLKDFAEVLPAESHSLARFLLSRPTPRAVPALKDLPQVGKLFTVPAQGPDALQLLIPPEAHQRLIAFAYLGAQGNTVESWTKAVETVYGFKSIDELEDAWLAWLAKPESALRPTAKRVPGPQNEKRDGDNLIPRAKLPIPSRPEQ